MELQEPCEDSDGDTCHLCGSLSEVRCTCVWTISATAAYPELTGL